jgi:hypothetical protein
MMPDISGVLDRMKNLQRFEVSAQLPDTFDFRGKVPYDMKIRDDEITVVIWAVSLEEAVDRVNRFLDDWSGLGDPL